jgi:hypothetical protein
MITELRGVGWVVHLAGMRKLINAYKIVVQEPDGKRSQMLRGNYPKFHLMVCDTV